MSPLELIGLWVGGALLLAGVWIVLCELFAWIGRRRLRRAFAFEYARLPDLRPVPERLVIDLSDVDWEWRRPEGP